MAVKFKPIMSRVVVEFIEEMENKTSGGIFLPETTEKEKPQLATVVAVGTDEDTKKNINEGDKIIFAKYSGTEVDFDGKKYLILNFDDVLAVIEND